MHVSSPTAEFGVAESVSEERSEAFFNTQNSAAETLLFTNGNPPHPQPILPRENPFDPTPLNPHFRDSFYEPTPESHLLHDSFYDSDPHLQEVPPLHQASYASSHDTSSYRRPNFSLPTATPDPTNSIPLINPSDPSYSNPSDPSYSTPS